jgi:hypothetical protein
MTIAQRVSQLAREQETNQRAGEFAHMVKFVLECGGIAKAAHQIETQGSKVGLLGPKLAAILQAGAAVGDISREVLLRQKAAASVHSLGGSAFADYSTIINGFAKRACECICV